MRPIDTSFILYTTKIFYPEDIGKFTTFEQSSSIIDMMAIARVIETKVVRVKHMSLFEFIFMPIAIKSEYVWEGKKYNDISLYRLELYYHVGQDQYDFKVKCMHLYFVKRLNKQSLSQVLSILSSEFNAMLWSPMAINDAN